MILKDFEAQLKRADWYNIQNTKTFNSQNNIFVNFTYGDWKKITDPDVNLKDNMLNFYNHLSEYFNITEVAICTFDFKHNEYLVNRVELYRITGNVPNKEKIMEIYFHKHGNLRPNQEISNPYVLTLMKYLNKKEVVGLIEHAYGFTVEVNES